LTQKEAPFSSVFTGGEGKRLPFFSPLFFLFFLYSIDSKATRSLSLRGHIGGELFSLLFIPLLRIITPPLSLLPMSLFSNRKKDYVPFSFRLASEREEARPIWPLSGTGRRARTVLDISRRELRLFFSVRRSVFLFFIPFYVSRPGCVFFAGEKTREASFFFPPLPP